MKDDRDSVLLLAVAAGDETALATLIGRYHRQVRAACARQCPPADLDDCVLAVFLVLHRRPQAAARAPVLLAWLLRVAHFVSLRARRTDQRRRRAEGGIADSPAAAHAPDATVLDHLDAALLGLKERQRAAILLHVVEGEAPASVAGRLGVTPENAGKLIQRGLEALRTSLRRRGVPIGAAALAACLARSANAVEATPADLVTLITRAPGARAEVLATKVIMTMTAIGAIPAAAIVLVGVLIGTGALAMHAPPRPAAMAEVPPVIAPAPVVLVDRRLAQPVTAMLIGRGILPVVRQLNCLLQERFDVVMPQHQFTVEFNTTLDGPVVVPDIAVVLPPGSTAATALDAIAEQAGCTWRMAEGLVCFEDRVQLLDPLDGTWDSLDVHRALTQGDAATVGRGIAAWLDLPQRRPITSLLIHPRSWLGRVALLGDARLAERFRQACPDFPGKRGYYDDVILGDPHPSERLGRPVDPTDLARLIRMGIRDPQVEEPAIAAVDALLMSPDGAPLAVYATHLAEMQSAGIVSPESSPRGFRLGNTVLAGKDGGSWVRLRDDIDGLPEALTRLLVIRGDGGLRCRLLDEGILQRYGTWMAGSGCHPAWNHRLAEAVRAGEEDATRQLAERILASSADPENWTRLLDMWWKSQGGAFRRLTGLVLGAGQRGSEAILAALAEGTLPADVLTASLEADQPDMPVSKIMLCTTVAGNPNWPDRLRQAAVRRLCSDDRVPRHPLAVGLATSLIEEGSKRSRSLLVGLGLQLRFSQGLIADDDPDLARTLQSSSPYLRAVALTIEDKLLTQARKRSKLQVRRDLVRRFPAADPLAASWPKAYGGEAWAHYLAPDPGRAATMLAMARNDPSPQVRLRAAAVGVRLLPEEAAMETLRSLALQEDDPAVFKDLDARIPTWTEEKEGAVSATWEHSNILVFGCPDFPEWLDNETETPNGTEWKGFPPDSKDVTRPDDAPRPEERPVRTHIHVH